jgi:hypothetical protein
MPSALVAGDRTRTRSNLRSGEVVSAAATKERSWTGNLLLTVPFLIFYLIQLAHHQLWRDELNAFGIAVASPTLASLFHHIHYEGHPWLWYVLLWGVAHITVDPIGMKVLQGAIGVAIYLVIGLGSPFSRLEKVLIFLGYFFCFEYTVMSRMYGLLVLLLLLYLRVRHDAPADRSREGRRLLTGALLLGLMASTDTLGIMLSGVLICEFLYARFVGRAVVEGRASTNPKATLAWAGLLYLGLLGFAVSSARLAPDISWRTTGHPFASAPSKGHLLGATINYVVMPYLPARPFRQGFFWNPSSESHYAALSLALVMVLAAYWAIFRRRPNLLLLVGLSLVGGALLGHLIYHGSMRHFGFTFLAFFAALWLMRSTVARLPIPAYVLLTMVAVGGLIADAQQWRRPFSEAEATATWLKANRLANMPIAGTKDTTVSSLAELLHRPIYMLDCDCSDTYLLFSNRRDGFDISQIPQRIVTARHNLAASRFLFIEDAPLAPESISFLAGNGLVVRPLVNFSEAQVADENFFVYDVSDVSR